MLEQPTHNVRDAAFSVAPARKGFLLRERRFAYIQYGETAQGGIELFDTVNDPEQFHNLANTTAYQPLVKRFQAKMAAKLKELRHIDPPARNKRRS
jgi:iduronate 2-sulfatase